MKPHALLGLPPPWEAHFILTNNLSLPHYTPGISYHLSQG